MLGLKVYVGVLAACLALLVAAVVLPSTGWIFRTAYWVGRNGPVDYGTSLEARLLESRDRTFFQIHDPQNMLYRANAQEVTDLGLAANTPELLSIAIRRTAQGTTFSGELLKVTDTKKDLARMQIELSRAGAKLEPDNAFWPMNEAVSWHILGDEKKSTQLYKRAVNSKTFDDHAMAEAELRARLLDQVRGNLGSQQEVMSFATVVLPHFASYKSICTHRIGGRPLRESGLERAEAARFGVLLAKNTESYIGFLVGIALCSVALRNDEKQVEGTDKAIYTAEEISQQQPEYEKEFLAAIQLRSLRREIELDNKTADDWTLSEELRPQAAATLLGLSFILVPLAFWLARRAADLREQGGIWPRCFPFASSLLGIFGGGALAAASANNGMTVVLLAGSVVSLVAVAISLLLVKPLWRYVLAGTHGVAIIAMAVLSANLPHPPGLGFLFAAVLPFLALSVENKGNGLAQGLAWIGWLVWTGALIMCCVSLHGSGLYGNIRNTFEPILDRMAWITLGAGLGAVGAAAMTPPGAKGHWVRASVAQALLAAALVLALGVNIRINKTLAQLIPKEKQQLVELQKAMDVPAEPVETALRTGS